MKKIKLDTFDKITVSITLFGILFGLWFFFRKSSYINVTFKLDQEESRYDPWTEQVGTRHWFTNIIQPGMVEKDGLGKPMAEISSLKFYDISPEKQVVYVKTRLKATYTKATNTYQFKGRPLAIGEPITINLERIALKGIITDVEGSPSPKKPIKLSVEAQTIEKDPSRPNTGGVEKFYAEAINPGDTVGNIDNEPIITVEEISTTPTTTITTTALGELRARPDPKYVDIKLKLTVSGYQIGNRYFLFEDAPISIGQILPLNFTTITIWPTITDITPIEN